MVEIKAPMRKLNMTWPAPVYKCGHVMTMEGDCKLFECDQSFTENEAEYVTFSHPPKGWVNKMTGFPGYLYVVCPKHADYEYKEKN